MINESKKALRREIKLVLANLDQRWIAKAHSEVCTQVVELIRSLTTSGSSPRHVLAWIPCFQGEVDLSMALDELFKEHSLIYLPRIDNLGVMSFVGIGADWRSALESGPRGIRQPPANYGENFIAPDSGDIFVVTPGLAFDPLGRRLGRGAGHYDRFFANPGLERAVKIGVGWSVQLVSGVPTDDFDVRMDWLCYERGVLKAELESDAG